MLPFGYFIYEKHFMGNFKQDTLLISTDLDDYVQSESTGLIEEFFDKVMSKVVY
jgi:hypothetical protein